MLSDDGAGRPVECIGDAAQTVVPLEQAGLGHAVFEVELTLGAVNSEQRLTLRDLYRGSVATNRPGRRVTPGSQRCRRIATLFGQLGKAVPRLRLEPIVRQ